MAADRLTTLHLSAYCGARVEAVGMLVDQMRSDAVLGRVIRLSRLGKGAVDDSEATTLEGRGAVGRGKIQQPSQRQRGRGELWRPYLAAGGRAEVHLPIDLVEWRRELQIFICGRYTNTNMASLY